MSRIKMTPKIKIALFCLQFYLVFLLILIIIKFIKGI
jgi:hypothetical protein